MYCFTLERINVTMYSRKRSYYPHSTLQCVLFDAYQRLCQQLKSMCTLSIRIQLELNSETQSVLTISSNTETAIILMRPREMF